MNKNKSGDYIPDSRKTYCPNEVPIAYGNYTAMRDPTTLKPHCCPVCNGQGIVPNGFYMYPQREYASTSTAPETCRSCGGKGYILV